MMIPARFALVLSFIFPLFIAACGNDPAPSGGPLTPSAGSAGAAGNASTIKPTNTNSAGSVSSSAGSLSSAGTGGTTTAPTQGTTSASNAAGSDGSAGKSGAAAPSPAAGSGSAGTSSTAGASSVAGSSAAGSGSEPDPFGDLFGDAGVPPADSTPPADASNLSCKDLFCFDVFDCAIFHLEESAVCNFVDCVDFICVTDGAAPSSP